VIFLQGNGNCTIEGHVAIVITKLSEAAKHLTQNRHPSCFGAIGTSIGDYPNNL